MPRYFNKLAFLLKRETTYGVDAAPTGAANGIMAVDVTITPVESERDERNLMRPYLGAQGVKFSGHRVKIEFSVELAGAGAAGTVPAFGAALRACGMSEIVTAGTKVDYLPVSTGYESASFYWNMDGVNHVGLGGRGNVQVQPFAATKIPRLKFTIWALHGTVADVALPTVDLTKFIDPLVVSKDNTPTFTLHGVPCKVENMSLDLGQDVQPRFLIGEESIQIVNRSAKGSVTVEAVPVATKNWVQTKKDHTLGALQVVHGVTAGNIVELGAPAVQIDDVTVGQTQNIINNTLALILQPTAAGNDELKLTFR